MKEQHRVHKIICYGNKVLRRAVKLGWLPGARYTNLRTLKGLDTVGFIDIDWKHYEFDRHLSAVKATTPIFTVAQDIEHPRQLSRLLDQVAQLRQHARWVIIVPKIRRFGNIKKRLMHRQHIWGYSVPSPYGSTVTPLAEFIDRPVHLLGGRPLAQKAMAQTVDVMSLDCNSITIDASYGRYFDGQRFRQHARGGYVRCVLESLRGINCLWET